MIGPLIRSNGRLIHCQERLIGFEMFARPSGRLRLEISRQTLNHHRIIYLCDGGDVYCCCCYCCCNRGDRWRWGECEGGGIGGGEGGGGGGGG